MSNSTTEPNGSPDARERERLLDPANNRVQLDTLQRAARAVGRTLKLELV